ncbi:hypothetical protein MRX96_056755 [Rhipicephalus microplus]
MYGKSRSIRTDRTPTEHNALSDTLVWTVDYGIDMPVKELTDPPYSAPKKKGGRGQEGSARTLFLVTGVTHNEEGAPSRCEETSSVR